jgi:hypothetical protein
VECSGAADPTLIRMDAHPCRPIVLLMSGQDAAKVEAERAAAHAKAAAEAKAAADLRAANASVGLTTAHSSLLSSYSHDRELSQPPESISGLSMGHLLGKGAYGSVYYGTWYGSPVAVKVRVTHSAWELYDYMSYG